jgi:hypothetical protein
MNPFIRLPRLLALAASFVLTLGFAASVTAQPTVNVVATDAVAVIGTTDYATLAFTRTGSTTSALTVNYALGGSAIKWNDYCRIQGDMPVAVTIPAGAASTTMTIVARANSTGANPATATFTLSASSSYLIGTQKTATITLQATSSPPPPLPVVTLSATDATAVIGTTDTGKITIARTGATTTALTVNYVLSGTAVPMTDYRLASGTLPVSVTIPVGASSTALTIQAIANSTNANPKTARFTLAANSAYTLGTAATATITITGAAPIPPPHTGLPIITVTATDPNAVIGSTDYAVLTFARTGATTNALTVNYALGGTAIKWNDYCRIQGDMPVAVTIPAGAASTTMTLIARANTTNANPETATFTLSPNSAYTLGTPATATITLLATAPTPNPVPTPPTVTVVASDASAAIGSVDTAAFTFTRTGDTSTALTVNYTLGGSAVALTDYRLVSGSMPVAVNIPAGATSATLTIHALANSTNANPETIVLSLATNAAYTLGSARSATATISQVTPAPTPPTVTVVASDASAAIGSVDTAAFTFTRTGDTSTALTVNYTLGGSAVALTDYRLVSGSMPVAVNIPAGATSATLTIQALANSTNANPETIVLSLTANAAYTLGSASSATATISQVVVPPPTPTPPPTPVPTPVVLNELDYTGLIMPKVGDQALRVLSPNWLELRKLTSKAPDPATVTTWNFVNSSGVLSTPALSQFAVTVDGKAVSVLNVGFRRRAFSADLDVRDLRIDNALYLQLATPVTEGQTVVVTNPGAQLWPVTDNYKVTTDPLRYSPAIHVNQEGYVPTLPKKAMVGYYLGNLGELPATGLTSFTIKNAKTGATVHQGSLTARRDVGYAYSPLPYQNVLQADFSTLTTPGEYYLLVPGLGASLPFLIDDGIAMNWLRTYSLGLYHQRCGKSNALPYTRFTHEACHVAKAEVPSPQSSYAFTWTTIASKSAPSAHQTAPQLASEASQLYPFVNKGTIDVSGGHHDAGDYSKYTTDVASLVHLLMFTADNMPSGNLDNLGIPESGDGISDIMQEAKQESDFLAKLQDADGGFYFIVYPKTREYEGGLSGAAPGDTQVVWPKNTSATAACVAALAQCASSPKFKQAYPATAAAYLQKAQLGWTFLTNAIAKYGLTGSYQKITFYGDEFAHMDELSWAAAEMYLATGDVKYQQQLFAWFPNPNDVATYRWNWIRMAESYGNAIRSYAFAARSGRLAASQLDAAYLAKCNTEIIGAADKELLSSTQSAYGSAFAAENKAYRAAGWYFSMDQAADMAVAYQINPKPEYLDALVTNMNYEGGTNPVNATCVTGLGLKRQHTVVNQFARADARLLAPTGIPIGNIQGGFDYLALYANELSSLTFPSDGATSAPYPFYDRWSDTWNVSTEFITVNQARSVLSASALVGQTTAKNTPWTSGTAVIAVPAGIVPLAVPTTLSVSTPGMDLSTARIVWEGRDQQPAFGPTYAFVPMNNGTQWVEVEINWPDGRRVFGAASFTANSAVVNWVNGSLPAGAVASADGGDGWNWVTSNPTPYSAPAVHQSNVAAGIHGHGFDAATATLLVGTTDKLFAYVYLDPANPPSTVMLMWTDSTGNAAHRAYWGANLIPWGTNGTASQFPMGPLPALGQWVRLEVPASSVGLAGATVQGMRFTLYGGRASWDVSGKSN